MKLTTNMIAGLLAGAVTVPAAGVAYAEDRPSLTITPKAVSAGHTVTVAVTCTDAAADYVAGDSDGVVEGFDRLLPAQFTRTFWVYPSAAQGEHNLSVVCIDGRDGTAVGKAEATLRVKHTQPGIGVR